MNTFSYKYKNNILRINSNTLDRIKRFQYYTLDDIWLNISSKNRGFNVALINTFSDLEETCGKMSEIWNKELDMQRTTDKLKSPGDQN